LAFYYLETSALVKLYVREPGTERLLALAARSSDDRLAILALTQVEFRSAVRRREGKGEIPSPIAAELLNAFERHVEGRFLIQAVTGYVLDTACMLVDRYALRAFDAVQLAGYMVLKTAAGADAPVLVSSNQELLVAAKREGAPVLDPCS
jgi:predicted nucleic acid-binding protein